MTLSKATESLNNEEYLFQKSRSLQGTDPWEAKSWIVTSLLMFPRKLSVLFEAYLFEKNEGNSERAAHYLKSVLESLGNPEGAEKGDPIRQRASLEIQKIVSALVGNCNPAEANGLLIEIFNALPKESQRSAITFIADATKDMEEYIKLNLMAFKSFPSLIPLEGTNFLNKVISRCKQEVDVTKISSSSKAFVLEICPRFLRENDLQLSNSLLEDVLDITVQFACAFVNESILGSGPPQPTDPWMTIFEIVEKVGLRLNWTLTRDLSARISGNTVWKDVEDKGMLTSKDSNSQQNEVFVVVMILFLHALLNYLKVSAKEEAILVEAFVTRATERPKKRLKSVDDPTPILTHSFDSKSKLNDHFLTAVRYYDRIKSDPILESRFQQFRTFTHFFSKFQVDVASYHRNYREAIQIVSMQSSGANPETEACRRVLLGSLHFFSDKHSMAADFLCQAMESLSDWQQTEDQALRQEHLGAKLSASSATQSRHLHFLPRTKQHLLSYCVRLFILILKDNVVKSDKHVNDLIVGHLIVLLQYIYPMEVDLMTHVMSLIKWKDKFAYPLFTTYIVHPDILEEFAALLSQVDSKVVLEISSTSAVTPSRRMGTRGANRGEKEEIRTILRKQILKARDNLDDITIQFFKEQRDSILTFIPQ